MPTASSFMRRPSDKELSVNWLELSGEKDHDDAVSYIRNVMINKPYQVSKNGRFAVLNVGAVKARIATTTGILSIRIDHLPEHNDQTHSGIYGYSREDDLEIATELSLLVKQEDVYPGLP